MSLYGQSDLVIRLWVKKQVSVESDLVSFILRIRCLEHVFFIPSDDRLPHASILDCW